MIVVIICIETNFKNNRKNPLFGGDFGLGHIAKSYKINRSYFSETVSFLLM
jgi:hypothetical protein